MTNEEFDEILERTNAVVCNREWYERAVKALEQTSPCDLCRYNPPSSGDGKPCSMCPACSGGSEE